MFVQIFKVKKMIKKIKDQSILLLFFSVAVTFIAYGFALTNFSLSIDGESPIFPDFAMGLGRWGANLIRFHLFNGYLPYFTLVLGIFLLSFTAVEIVKILNLKGFSAYAFCALFLTFPQISYQMIFTIQADTVPFGFLLSVISLGIFFKCSENFKSIKSIASLLFASLLLMFALSLYQSIIYLPVTIFIIVFFQRTYNENFSLKSEFINCLFFSGFIIVSSLFYYISVKLLCPPVEGGYLSSYVAGESNNRVLNFLKLWAENLKGKAYYGNTMTAIMSLFSILLIIKFVFDKKHFLLRFLSLILILLIPYSISFFITNGAHPPRLYVSLGISFAFILTFLLSNLKTIKLTAVIVAVIAIINVYFITSLYHSNSQIFQHDKELAKKIDLNINLKYPDFDPTKDYVYFYGSLPYDHHQAFRLPDSDAFGGSLFYWDGGNNWRIINFYRFNDIAYYKILDNKESFNKVKDSIETMPLWPHKESIKKIDNVVIVKLGMTKGTPLPFE